MRHHLFSRRLLSIKLGILSLINNTRARKVRSPDLVKLIKPSYSKSEDEPWPEQLADRIQSFIRLKVVSTHICNRRLRFQ